MRVDFTKAVVWFGTQLGRIAGPTHRQHVCSLPYVPCANDPAHLTMATSQHLAPRLGRHKSMIGTANCGSQVGIRIMQRSWTHSTLISTHLEPQWFRSGPLHVLEYSRTDNLELPSCISVIQPIYSRFKTTEWVSILVPVGCTVSIISEPGCS